MNSLHGKLCGALRMRLLIDSRKWMIEAPNAAILRQVASQTDYSTSASLIQAGDVAFAREGNLYVEFSTGLGPQQCRWHQNHNFTEQNRSFAHNIPLLLKQNYDGVSELQKLDIRTAKPFKTAAVASLSIDEVGIVTSHHPTTAALVTKADLRNEYGSLGTLVKLPALEIPLDHVSPGTFSSVIPGLLGVDNLSSRRYNRGPNDLMILPKGIARGFAKTVSVPPQMQKPMKLRLYMGSPGVIGEPYKKPPPPLSILRRWFTKEGWSRRKQSFMAMIKTTYTIAKLRQKTKGYSQQRFYQEASDLYKQINIALAEGERTTLRHLVTDSVFSGMKNELKHRENAWAKVNWELVGPINKIRTLQGRLIGVDKNNHDNAFVQLTLRILSKQKFAAYDKRGKLIAGDPNKELLVEDYWVFEKPLLLTEAKWRLCGRLSV